MEWRKQKIVEPSDEVIQGSSVQFFHSTPSLPYRRVFGMNEVDFP